MRKRLPDTPRNASPRTSRLGDTHTALQAASDACHAAPRLPEPHYAYGQAWQALSDPMRATQEFAAAVRLAPTWPDAWISLGIARYREGAIEDAKTQGKPRASRTCLSYRRATRW